MLLQYFSLLQVKMGGSAAGVELEFAQALLKGHQLPWAIIVSQPVTCKHHPRRCNMVKQYDSEEDPVDLK